MDYILQMEKLYKFFEFTLDMEEIHLVYQLKHKFNNDLNLLGGFIKDFLTVKNDGAVYQDDLIYDKFVLWFETVSDNVKEALEDLVEYAEYYLMLVFEDIKDSDILCAVTTVNACFAIDCYPYLMHIFSEFYHNRINVKKFRLILKALTDVVLDRYENLSDNVLSYSELEKKINNITQLERVAV